MQYSNDFIGKVKQKVLSKIYNELRLAQKNGEVEKFLDKYGIVMEEERLPIDIRTSKILVIGELAGNKKDYQMRAKKMEIDPMHIEFLDYEQAKKFSGESLRYSRYYSDIIYGPTPHSTVENGEGSSLLATIKRNPIAYPRLIEARANSSKSELKISITGFIEGLKKTYYYETMLED